jgi:hypothetical protein
LEYKVREWVFREVVINFLTGGKEGEGSITDQPEDSFCIACKKAGFNRDCSTCTRDFKVIDLHKARGEVKSDGK